MSPDRQNAAPSIWWFAFGYFACYVPYSALTKALSKGLLPGMDAPLNGTSILPVTLMASAVSMISFLTLMGWWKYATRRTVFGVSLPSPTRWTFLSGLCTSAVIVTTTLAYTFEGVSIVLVMLLMRGGVLVLAPIVDAISKRHVRWFSWAGLVLSLGALSVTLVDGVGSAITLACAIDVAVYLAAYFVRLRFMSRLAKGSQDANVRFFVEEQLVAAPAAVVMAGLAALFLPGRGAELLRQGFTDYWGSSVLVLLLLVGVLSQGTGVFGGLILLDKRENTFCVPVNRASSVLAGIVASLLLTWLVALPMPETPELVGAGVIIGAIAVLSLAPIWERRQARLAQAGQPAQAGETDVLPKPGA